MMLSGFFIDESGERHLVYWRKGLSLPEGVPIFLLLLQHSVVIDYCLA